MPDLLNPDAVQGHNDGPDYAALEAARIAQDYVGLFNTYSELESEFGRVPSEVNDDATALRVGGLIKRFRDLRERMEQARVVEVEPYLRRQNGINTTFNSKRRAIQPDDRNERRINPGFIGHLQSIIDAHQQRKEAEERAAREAAEAEQRRIAEEARAAQARRDAEAAAAKRAADEAAAAVERARVAEERAAARRAEEAREAAAAVERARTEETRAARQREADEAAVRAKAEREKAEALRLARQREADEAAAVAAHAVGEAKAAEVVAGDAGQSAIDAKISTLAKSADLVRVQGNNDDGGGVLLTTKKEPYCIMTDRSLLTTPEAAAKLIKYFNDKEIEKALRGWARETNHNEQIAGAEIGWRKAGVTR